MTRSTFATALAVAAIASAATAGCIGKSPITGIQYAQDPVESVKVLVPSWHRALVLGVDRTYTPFEGSSAAADPSAGRVYIGTSNGTFQALRSEDGKLLWSFDAGESIHSTPVLSEDRSVVYFGNEAGLLFALRSSTGEEIWRYEASAEIRCKPLLHEKILVVKDTRGKVHAVDGVKGTALWLYRGDTPEGFVLSTNAGVALVAGRVMAGFTDGMVRAIRLLDGTVSWEADISEFTPEDNIKGDEKLDVNTTPVLLAHDSVLFSSFKGGLFALDPETGSTQWRRSDLKRVSGMTFQGGVIYVSRASSGVVALDAEGETLWESTFTSGSLSDPVAEGGRLFVTDSKSGLIVLARESGRVLDRFAPAWGGTGKPLVRAGRVFFLSNGGHMWTFHVDQPLL